MSTVETPAAVPAGKDLLQSRSFWGAVLMLLSVALKAYGLQFDPAQVTDQLLAVVQAVLPLGGFLLTIVGTLFRKHPITSVAGVTLRSASPPAALLLFALTLAPATTWGQQIECPDRRLAADIPADVRNWFRNPDGSCVQCSIGMCGVDQNVPAAATLLWNTDYGPRERGGSGPDRVANYCRKRGIQVYNVTGASTFEWMKWACATGRGAAIGAGSAHFQTLMGHDPRTGTWYVCNNNSPRKIDVYDEAGFRRLHLASGPWIVILDYPPHPERPLYACWW